MVRSPHIFHTTYAMDPNSDVTPQPVASGDLQFQTAEAVDNRPRCPLCQTAMEGPYYQIQGVNVCPACAEARRTQQELPDSRQKFLRAFLYGSGAAFASWVVWSVVEIATGMQLGILAIGVGWAVGTAIRKGTVGHTSRKYQIMAVLLTYLAISMSFIPLLLSEMVKKGDPAKNAAAQQKGAPPVTVKPEGPPPSLGLALLGLGVMALVSPLLGAVVNFPMGLIGVFIVFLGLQRAWLLTKPDDALIAGPFE
jgi:hypothetical protein